MISKLNELAAHFLFNITSMISEQNCMTKLNYHLVTFHLKTPNSGAQNKFFESVQIFYHASISGWFVKSCQICPSFFCN